MIVTFKQAAESWLQCSQARNQNPIRPATTKGYSCYLNKHINPRIGHLPLQEVKNKAVKEFISHLHSLNPSPKTINCIFNVIELFVASVLDEEGEQLHPRKWNRNFLDIESPKPRNAPSITKQQIEAIIARADGRYRVLLALLAGTGLRIGEALAIELGPQSPDATTISTDRRTIYIRKSVW